MLIYKDIVTGDEIVSDTWEMKEVDGVVYEIDCKRVTKGAERIDIGANPSAEEQEEALDEGTEQVIDVPHAFRLVYMGDEKTGDRLFKKKSDYFKQLKAYLKKVVEKLKEDNKDAEFIKAFQSRVGDYFKNVVGPNFKDYEFYTGESMDDEGMVILLNYREDGVTPYITIWKDGLKDEKV